MTSLNLLPVGQLDGGHVTYAIFGPRGQKWIGRLIYAGVVGLAIHAAVSEGWLGWVVYAVLLTLVLRVGHPPVVDEYDGLGLWRKVVAVIGLLVFLSCFMPVPITVVS
jgi:membrane-associated protease RseP (regulator of RpoE activity)